MLLFKLVEHALMITSFVFIMMLLIEYINVQTRGRWQKKLKKSRFGSYLVAAILGAVPGCLGAFSVVSLYSHGIMSFGALVTTMIATSGDEAFVMFSMFPEKALLITVLLFGIALIAGYLTDFFISKYSKHTFIPDHPLELHEEDECNCFPKELFKKQLKNISFPRALLMGILILFLSALFFNLVGPASWDWKKITFASGTFFALFVVSTVPDHFLEKHLWEHVLKKHLLRIFLWTFGALLVIHFIELYLNLDQWIEGNYLTVLMVAVLIGIIPESGPHMIFVTLFANGSLPFSILIASSIVQDGHGMLPMLAVSRKGFILVKIINVFIGFLVGLTVFI